MVVAIHPSSVSGTIQAPASKSSMQRACAAALLHKGETIIKHPGHSNDDRAALALIEQMGATVNSSRGNLKINSSGVKPVGNQVNCGESGLGIRMFAPIISLCNEEITINGEGSLLNRPMDFFDEVFPMLGVDIASNEGKLPLVVKGPLKPGNIQIDGSLSSQFLTGLLMAYAAAGASDVAIKVTNLKSKPYIDLTLAVMREFGCTIPENRDYEEFYFPAGKLLSDLDKSSLTKSYTVEGDWSGGAFLLVAGAIAGNVVINGLDVFSTQADKAILHALQQSGAIVLIQPGKIEIAPSSAKLKAFHFDATECPDLFPPLVALAAYCDGQSVIVGASRLTHKESNRALTLRDEFAKMGIKITLQDDLMSIEGGSPLQGARVHSRHDHRIAMACAVASLKAEGEIIIEEAEAINKSYPDFYSDLRRIGVSVVVHGHSISQ